MKSLKKQVAGSGTRQVISGDIEHTLKNNGKCGGEKCSQADAKIEKLKDMTSSVKGNMRTDQIRLGNQLH